VNDFVTTVVGTTTFNALVNIPDSPETTGTDGTITLSSDGGNYFNTYSGGSPDYDYVLSQGSDAANGVITLGSLAHPLTIGDVYQVEAWSSYGGSYTAHADGDPAVNFTPYAKTFAIGTFTASASTFTFDYGPSLVNNSGAGFINDVVVRDLGAVPEPSTYAMMLAGGIGLLFLLRRSYAMTS
jgi:hypothetical protein